MLAKTIFSRLCYNSGIFLFIGAVFFYIYKIIFHVHESYHAAWVLICGLILILCGAYIKSAGNHIQTRKALHLAAGMCYILLILALLLNYKINAYAMTIGFLATAYILVVELRKRMRHNINHWRKL
jgi:predicted membrane protein